ncbi:MAG TPA: methyltransferase [Longimicrobiaceae bacterium]|nr:methyltransferase [Longimicrobiaceae bacterium]
MPLKLPEAEHQKLFETNEAPAPLLDLLSAYGFRMLSTAVRLGVFEVLREGPLIAAEAAGRLGVDPRGLELLLRPLATSGYLERDGEGYANTPMTEKWLLADSRDSMVEMVAFHDTLQVHLWGDLEKSVRAGEPPRDYYRWLREHPDTLRRFQELLGGLARTWGDKIAELSALPESSRRLLDLGGGHGLYTAAFLRRYPGLRATVFDLPEALEVGRENAVETGLEDRICFQGGDLLRDDFGGGYDVVLLASTVHCFLPEQNAHLVRRVRDALNPGGRVVIVEQLSETRPGDTLLRRAFLQTFSINLFHLMGAQLYSQETIAEWLADGGFESPEVQPVGESSFTLLAARRTED